jgi:hypothetical protein
MEKARDDYYGATMLRYRPLILVAGALLVAGCNTAEPGDVTPSSTATASESEASPVPSDAESNP